MMRHTKLIEVDDHQVAIVWCGEQAGAFVVALRTFVAGREREARITFDDEGKARACLRDPDAVLRDRCASFVRTMLELHA
jgi:hypothetical protein